MGASRRIPALDGLRAIAIVFVLLSHASRTPNSGWIRTLERAVNGALGELGVRIFFVMSGFLITSLLLAEREKRGAISLKRFYARRALRILPALYVYLLAIFIATRLGWLHAPTRDLLHALTFSTNYAPEHAWPAGHVWSLSVEEQFYILWPAMLALLGLARGLRSAVAFVLLAPVIRIALFYGVPSYRAYVGESFETVGDAIAVGCILAGTRDWLFAQPLYRRFLESRLVWLVVPIVLLAHRTHDHPFVNFTVAIAIMNLGIAVLIDRVTRQPPAFLEHPVMRFIGVRSYSMYLWQQPFMEDAGSVFTSVPMNFACAFVMAVLSFALVEQPVLKLKRFFEI